MVDHGRCQSLILSKYGNFVVQNLRKTAKIYLLSHLTIQHHVFIFVVTVFIRSFIISSVYRDFIAKAASLNEHKIDKEKNQQ